MRKVVITGAGIISALGRGVEPTLTHLREGRSGIRLLASIDASALHCRIGGEVPAETLAGSEGGDRFTRLALLAADDAAGQAGDLQLPGERIGAIIGTGMGGAETLDNGYRRLYGEHARIHPATIPLSMYNAAPSAIARRFGAKGIAYAVASACASGTHAIGLAAQAIRAGQADAMFAGGADAPLTFGILRAWEALRVLAVDNEHPEAACRPFGADRKGLVLAEGAAVVVLESLENAERRGATILGGIEGFGATSDAGHLTDPSADGAARAMSLALSDAGWSPSEVDYINAHGTGTRANDATETAAIRAVFGETVPPVSSTKSMHGHAMGASGAIELIVTLLALQEGFLPPTINLDTPDPACDLDYVPHAARPAEARRFLSNSFGFGGMNAVLAASVARR